MSTNKIPVTVLSKRPKENPTPEDTECKSIIDLGELGLLIEPKPFKLINSEDWVMVANNPASETTFFQDGHAAMSVISVIGSKGTGKSTLLNNIAGKKVFQTNSCRGKDFTTKHMTRGIDIYTTHHRILLDCQPFLSSSILDDFLSGKSKSQFANNSRVSEPSISCQMISLQLATFLIAVSDYVIILLDYIVDIDLIKLISSAIMMIGEDDVRAKFVIYCPGDEKVNSEEFKILIDNLLGQGKIDKFFYVEQELIEHITPYTDLKTDLHHQDPATFTGHKWITSCKRIWNDNIRSSTMFLDYANLLHI